MSFHLPTRIDPLALAKKQGHLAGSIDLSQCARIAGHLSGPDGEITIDLAFAKVDSRAVIEGVIQAKLALICQRCLEPLDWQGKIGVRLAMIEHDSEAEALPAGYEPFLLVDDDVTLVELVEDELLLALPEFPRHAKDCRQVMTTVPEAQAVRINPFAQLAELKINGVTHGRTKK